jgi:hypothetical protein
MWWFAEVFPTPHSPNTNSCLPGEFESPSDLLQELRAPAYVEGLRWLERESGWSEEPA